MINADIVVMSDGSGYKDGFGGYASLAFTPDGIWKLFRMAGIHGVTVDRAEFTGCLEGLQMAWELWQQMPARDETRRPVVIWMTDRENLLLSAKNVQARSNCPDLWARYVWYEERMSIHPDFVSKEMEKTNLDFKMIDVQASTGREILKAYIATVKVPKAYLYDTF